MTTANSMQNAIDEDLAYNALNDAEGDHDRDFRAAVTKAILTLGIPAHLNGFYYLREAIILKVNDQNNNISMTKILYPGIAKMFNTTAAQVERGIRHAIEVTWRRSNFKSLESIFSSSILQSTWKPSNAEFIATIAVSLNLAFDIT